MEYTINVQVLVSQEERKTGVLLVVKQGYELRV